MRTESRAVQVSIEVCRMSRSTKTRSPTADICQPDQIIQPAKQAQFFSRESQAQYQAFVRFAVASSAALSAIALSQDLAFGTFHSGRALLI
jgi:hypothetical protein